MNKLKHTPGEWREFFNGMYWEVKCQHETTPADILKSEVTYVEYVG